MVAAGDEAGGQAFESLSDAQSARRPIPGDVSRVDDCPSDATSPRTVFGLPEDVEGRLIGRFSPLRSRLKLCA
jgi:hypothetical protein